MGIITFFYDWEWRGAERAFVRSIELNPNNGEALAYYALFLAFEGRVDEAMTTGRNALALDPLAPLINMHVGWAHFTAGETAYEPWQAKESDFLSEVTLPPWAVPNAMRPPPRGLGRCPPAEWLNDSG